MTRLLFVLLLVLASCVPPEAIEQARTEVAISQGYQVAPDATPAIVAIGAASEDAWSVQLWTLSGEALPDAVKARLEARGDLPAGYGR